MNTAPALWARNLWAAAQRYADPAVESYRAAALRADIVRPVALLAARLLVARVFLLSGLTKWDGFSISGDAYYLFAEEFFGRYNLPRLVSDGLTVMSAVGELALPILLIFGLFSRASALGLLAMTLVIQLFVFPDAWWNVHAWWSAALLVTIGAGPGALSLDRMLRLEPARSGSPTSARLNPW
jgi:putative oxidoreductase